LSKEEEQFVFRAFHAANFSPSELLQIRDFLYHMYRRLIFKPVGPRHRDAFRMMIRTLLNCLVHFDHTLEHRFSSYYIGAKKWELGKMKRASSNGSSAVQKKLLELIRAEGQFFRAHNILPTS